MNFFILTVTILVSLLIGCGVIIRSHGAVIRRQSQKLSGYMNQVVASDYKIQAQKDTIKAHEDTIKDLSKQSKRLIKALELRDLKIKASQEACFEMIYDHKVEVDVTRKMLSAGKFDPVLSEDQLEIPESERSRIYTPKLSR